MENFLPKVWSCPVPRFEWVKLFFSPCPPYFRAKCENLRFRRELPREEHNSSRRIFQSGSEKKKKEKGKEKIDSYQLVSEVAFFNTAKWIIAILVIVSKNHCLLLRSREYLIFSTLISSHRYFNDALYISCKYIDCIDERHKEINGNHIVSVMGSK